MTATNAQRIAKADRTAADRLLTAAVRYARDHARDLGHRDATVRVLTAATESANLLLGHRQEAGA